MQDITLYDALCYVCPDDSWVIDNGRLVWKDAKSKKPSQKAIKKAMETLATPPLSVALTKLVATRRAEVEDKMRAVLAKGCAHDGHTFQCQEADGARINNAVATARMAVSLGTPFTALTWTTANNQAYPIKTLAELEALAVAINARITTAFTARNAHKTALMTLAKHAANAREATVQKRITAVTAYDITADWS